MSDARLPGDVSKCWVAVGDEANWERGLDAGQIWGLVPKHENHWARLEAGDLLLMYAKAPVKGVVGAGIIRRKFRQTVPLWKEEISEGRVIWPLRFEFDVVLLLPLEQWQGLAVSGRDYALPHMAGISPVAPEKALPVLHELQQRVAAAAASRGAEATVSELGDAEAAAVRQPEPELAAGVQPPPPSPPLSLHDETRELIYEVGQIQRLFPEREYTFEGGRLDVVWRRVLRSVPTYAFEVHISGNIESALAKLTAAHRLWNSRLYLVTEEPSVEQAGSLLETSFPYIARETRVLTVDQVRALHARKRAYFELEEELGLR